MAYVKLFQDFLKEPHKDALNEWVKSLLESTKNPFDVLGIPRGSDVDTAKSAYRKLANRFHPDRNPGDKAAEEKFKEISAAYEMIKSPGKNKRVVDGEPTQPHRNTYSSYSNPYADTRSKHQTSWDKTEEDDRKRRAEREAGYKKAAEERQAGYDKAHAEREAQYKKTKEENETRFKSTMDKHNAEMTRISMNNLEGNCKIMWKDLKNWESIRNGQTVYFIAPNGDYTLVIDVVQFSSMGKSVGEYKIKVLTKNKDLDLEKDVTGYPNLQKELFDLQNQYNNSTKKAEPEIKSWYKKMFN